MIDMSNQNVCERCGNESTKLYSVSEDDGFGDVITKNVCWECDHDVMNGGSLFDDVWDVLQDRKENDYAYDPINNPPPY